MTSIEQQQTTSEILSRRAHGMSPRASRRPGSSSRPPRARASPTRRAVSSSTSPAESPARTRATDSAPVVDAIHRQADLYLHQCFMVGVYEPYVETCRLLAELSPCAGANQKSILVNSGAEAVENAVKIARTATGRPAVIVFDQAFHGRTLLTMTMTSKVHPYKAGFGPVRARGLPRAGALPVPRHHHGGRARRPREALQVRRRPEDGRVRGARTGPGRGRLRADDARFPRPAGRGVPGARHPLRRRRGAVRAPGARARSGRSSTTTGSSPTCSSPASRSAAGSRSRASPAAPS